MGSCVSKCVRPNDVDDDHDHRLPAPEEQEHTAVVNPNDAHAKKADAKLAQGKQEDAVEIVRFEEAPEPPAAAAAMIRLEGRTIIQMAESVIMSGIEKLRRLLNPHVKGSEEDLFINEMEILLSLVRTKEVTDRGSMLRHLISKFHQLKLNDFLFKKALQEITTQLCKLGEDGVGEGEVVGLEEDVNCFLYQINDPKNFYSPILDQWKPFVAQIKGTLGKTTLARLLFNRFHFEPRLWVDCKDITCLDDLLLCLVGQLGDDNYEYLENAEYLYLKLKLVRRLRNKPFIIVLDDIMDNLLEKFLKLLPYHRVGNKSMLLLIVRDMKYEISSDYYIHRMKYLDQDRSWKLLLEMMSPENKKFPKHVERKAKAKLMKHSGGLPLAIKEVAMEWAEMRRTGAEWEDVVDSKDLELRGTLAALESSFYQRLDPHMKLLFLHLGLFKLGTIIRRLRLFLTFVASGVLGGEECRECLDKMIYEEDFIEIKGYSNVYINGIFHQLAIMMLRKRDEAASYRVIDCSRERFNCSTYQNERLVCVSFHGGGCLDAIPSYWMSFSQLRVLDFEDFGLKFLPETVGELIELRYLGLRNNYLEELPHSLRNLINLEVLDIALNFMVKVPDIIWEMDALAHLFMSDIVCMEPLKIEALWRLTTITYISVDNWAYDVSGLEKMTYLRKLGIEGLDESSDVSKLFRSLAVLENLNCLVLRGFRFRSMPVLDDLSFLHGVEELKLDGLIKMLPSAENFPPKLDCLTLVNSCLDNDPMSVLEKLKSLTYLKLQNAYTGEEMVISEDGFPMLEKMCVGELWQLKNIQVRQGGLNRLWELEIYSCPCLHNLPKISAGYLEIVTIKKIATEMKKSPLFHEKVNVVWP